MLFGVDVSHWQGNVNWAKIKNYGAVFMFAKAAEVMPDGRYLADKFFRQNIEGAKKQGLITGAYLFFHPKVGVGTQVRFFKQQVDGMPVDLPLVADIEASDALPTAKIKVASLNFLEEMEQTFGRTPILYSRDGLVKAWGLLDWVTKNSHLYWKALYNNNFSGYPAAFWQYSDTFRIPGITTYLDANRFFGTISDLMKLTDPNATIPTPEEPKPIEFPKTGVVVASALNIRALPDYESRIVGQVRSGQKLNIIGIENDRWAALDRGGYCAIHGATGVFIKIT